MIAPSVWKTCLIVAELRLRLITTMRRVHRRVSMGVLFIVHSIRELLAAFVLAILHQRGALAIRFSLSSATHILSFATTLEYRRER